MPKLTFFNLPENKRKVLIDAAENEFARVPLHEASIANIVKSAGIPRGSFYQYFENKDDLYFYLLDEKLKEGKEHFLTMLEVHNGDIIEAVIDMHHNFLIMMPDEEEENFIKNALLYATHKVENSFRYMIDSTHDHEHFKKMLELVNKELVNVRKDTELVPVLQIIAAIAFHNLIDKLSRKLSDEEAIKHFRVQMELIKNGIYQR
ncbi:TetR/AcrR family transcriptional regulator [Rossellomorea vietnamensis]|uniref:TetR/AcrR family transcriptional regulator n=1 Tax=Rossellomorea vietnamensis TaxID=218284 RepID=A0A5D4NYT4_9BACI|nr:TetR family transcriptional regulator [Rossellomorea vietnamensis]TYS18546.1 TetR/AcrR family transcriptional regulator [Rossellomorea vietnamensis]